ncbi:type I-E CRISPR-associated endoribonuclease Cas2e [Aminomonas paucivorans]|uniref:type I-E CRISPR-associated endoribonuclease Cas2e n=1 Tax=Aminomonas paucivorans TaxID=81412 RepID=UPI0038CBFA24
MVLVLEKVPPSLRGELCRWLIEPKAGVFVGQVSALVREKLWRQICQGAREGSCLLLYSSNTEQGFRFDVWGSRERLVADWEGLTLVTRSSHKGD